MQFYGQLGLLDYLELYKKQDGRKKTLSPSQSRSQQNNYFKQRNLTLIILLRKLTK